MADGVASVTLSTGESELLIITGFGFNLPATEPIAGVVVELERAATGSVIDENVRLHAAPGLAGNGKAQFMSWPTAWNARTLGSSTDTWGLTLTGANVNDPAFGVAFSVARFLAAGTAQIRNVVMKVYPATGGMVSASGTVVVSDDSILDPPWTTPSEARIADTVTAGVHVMGGSPRSQPLVVTGFAPGLGPESIVHGVEFVVRRRGTAGAVRELNALLSPAMGSINMAGSVPLGASFTDVTFGGPTDTWGVPLEAPAVLASTFGLRYAVQPINNAEGTAEVDAVTMRVLHVPGRVSVDTNVTAMEAGPGVAWEDAEVFPDQRARLTLDNAQSSAKLILAFSGLSTVPDLRVSGLLVELDYDAAGECEGMNATRWHAAVEVNTLLGTEKVIQVQDNGAVLVLGGPLDTWGLGDAPEGWANARVHLYAERTGTTGTQACEPDLLSAHVRLFQEACR